jgi:DNA-binding transcriptional LysR family regulator
MDYIGIEAFLAIVKAQSLTRAAELLNLTQSSISHRLKLLEDEMGTKLIERGKGVRGISLTSVGEEFIPLAERWADIGREIQVLKTSGPKLSLSIGSVDSVNAYVLPPVYRRLTQHSPAIRIQIRTQQSVELYDLIERREIDIAFVLRERHIQNIESKPFFTEPMVIIRRFSPGELFEETIHPRELEPENELFINWDPSYHMWHDQWWDPLSPSRIRLDTAQLILAIMDHPKQWAIVPLSMAYFFKKTGEFTIQYLSDPPPNRVCYQITHKYPKYGTVQGLNLFTQYAELLKQDMNVDLI